MPVRAGGDRFGRDGNTRRRDVRRIGAVQGGQEQLAVSSQQMDCARGCDLEQIHVCQSAVTDYLAPRVANILL